MLAVALSVLVLGCSPGRPAGSGPATGPTPAGGTTAGGTTPSISASQSAESQGPAAPAEFRDLLPGMPPIVGHSVYGATGASMMSPVVAHDPAYLYVPDAGGGRVTVISQQTGKIIRVLPAGPLSQHVTPSYDLRLLYTSSSAANQIVVIDPRTAKVVRRDQVPRPYNLYFTPDGKQSVVMEEQHDRIVFSDPHTFKARVSRKVPGCRGPNHADFSANGQFLIVTCEFSGALVKISTLTHDVLGVLQLGGQSMPQDIRISPDGKVFYVADMGVDRVRLIDGTKFTEVGAIATPKQPHGLYPSRDGKLLYVSDRGAGKVSVVSNASHQIVATWTIPGGGSPDMGGVSADGTMLWLSGRYDGEVYGFDTATGQLRHRIKVGGSPHGLAVWPQPGRYSLGHTGNMR